MGAKKKPLDDARRSATSASTADEVGEAGSQVGLRRLQGAAGQKAAGQIIEDEDTDETVEKIVAWLDERKLI